MKLLVYCHNMEFRVKVSFYLTKFDLSHMPCDSFFNDFINKHWMQHKTYFHITAIIYRKYHFPLYVLSSIIPLFSSEEEILLPSQLLWILNCYSRAGLFRSLLFPRVRKQHKRWRMRRHNETDLWKLYAFHLAIYTIWSPLFLILTLTSLTTDF